MKSYLFKPTLLATLVALSFSASASIVRSDVDYQYFRDLAENKGKFALGASNVEILNNDGVPIGTMLPNITMVDFSPILTNGVATLVTHAQYLVSVAHNGGYTTANFGYDTENPDSHNYSYRLVSRNNYNDDPAVKIAETNFSWDYQSPRLSKLVTEVVPATAVDIQVVQGRTEKVLTTDMFFNNPQRYTHFIRAGSGVQRVQDPDGTRRDVQGGGFLTGGMQMTRHTYNRDALNFIGSPYTTTHGPLVTFTQPGDSGSGLFVWDAQDKRWLFAATIATITHNTNNYIAYRRQFYENLLARDTAGTIHNTEPNAVFTWSPNSENSIISDGTTTLNVALFNENLAERWDAVPRIQHGKNVFFSGEDSTLTLVNNINQGAGYLNFNANVTVNSQNADTTWLGGGVIVEEGKKVTWQVKNPQNDRLSKLGSGTLYVNGTGKNLGAISVGDGIVILDQQADSSDNKQAFSELGIVSGRPTVVLNSSDQMNADNIYFGYRGGRLDVNGNDLAFNHIQSIDDGARIVNHNVDQTANIRISGNKPIPNAVEGDLLWGDWGTRFQEKDIYVYRSQYDGQTYYLAYKNNSRGWFPTDGRSNDDWEVLSKNDRDLAITKALARRDAKSAVQNQARKLDAYNGYFGENDENRTNGKLNVTYNPTIEGSTLLLNGGTQLEGALSVENGTLLLSGRPTPYARNRQTNTEVIKDNDWLNRTFNATTFVASNEAKLEIGRNVSEVNGNFEVSDNASAMIGFTQGKSTQCIRSDYTGNVSCSNNHTISDEALDTWDKTHIKGNANLTDNARLELGSKAEMSGAITAEKTTALLLNNNAVLNLNDDSRTGSVTASESSTINLAEGKTWTTLADSTVGNLNINNATVNLNDVQANTAPVPNRLTVNNLTGSGTFNFVVDMLNATSDMLIANNLANGTFNAEIKTFGEANSDRAIKLLQSNQFDNFNFVLNTAVQSANYLYSLVKEENAYWLKAVDRRLSFTFDTEELTTNSISASQLSTKGTYQVIINPTGDDPVSTGKTLLISAANEEELNGIDLELNGADSNNEIQIGPYKYRIEKETYGYYLVTDHQQAILTEGTEDPNYDLVEEEKPVADFNGDLNNSNAQNTNNQTNNTSGNGNTQTAVTFTPELPTQVNAIFSITSTLDDLVRSENTDNWKVWSNLDNRTTELGFPNQDAKQRTLLTQVGVEKNLGNKTWLGAVISQSKSNNDFVQGAGKNSLTMLSVYGKKQWKNGLFIGLDISGGQSRNSLTLNSDFVKFQRNVVSLGVNLGQQWNLAGFNVKPSVGARYHHLSSADYELQGIKIHTPNMDMMSYNAGIDIAKTFTVAGLRIKPSLSSSYIHSNQKLTTQVNSTNINQKLGSYFKHEIGLNIGGSQFSVQLSGGIMQGKAIKRQNTAALKLIYQW